MLFGGFEPQRARPSFSTKDKEFLYDRQKGKCNGCKVKFPMRNMTVDHIKPFSKGGSDKPSNLQLLCGACNSTKGNGTQAQFQKRLKQQGVAKSTSKSSSTSKKTTATKKTAAKSTAKKKPTRTRKNADPFEGLFGF